MSSPDVIKVGAKSRREDDLRLWQQWKESGEKPEDMRPLLSNLRGIIRSRANIFANNVELPPAAVHAEFKKQAIKAIRTYDPTKGAALHSWVFNNIKKGNRFINNYQNTARMGEKQIRMIGQFNAANAFLDDALGREPTTSELADHLGWSEKEVMSVGTADRKEFIESAFEGDPTTIMPSREAETLRFVRHQLSPEELLVYEYTLGVGGKPQLKPGQIARKMGISSAKVTRIRAKIYDMAKGYM